MRDPHTDNILSAYLDGELSEQERHEVERRLAGDPAARRLLDEFRTIRAALQGIPRQSLGPSFRDRVLERVEDAVGHPADQGTQRLPVPQTRERRLPIGRLWRAIVWPAMAVAVAVLVMVFHSEPGGPRGQLAQRPDQVARGRVEPDKMASDGKVLKKDNSTAAPSASTPSEAPPPAAVGRTRIGPVALSSPPASPPATPPATPPVAEPVAEPPALRAAGQSADVAAGRSASTERVAGVPAEVSVAPSPVAVVRADRDRAPHADRDEQVTQPDSDANEHLVIVRLVVDRPAVARRTLAKMFDRRQIVRAETGKAHYFAWSSQLERARVDGSPDQPAASEEEARRDRSVRTSAKPSSSARPAKQTQRTKSEETRARGPTSEEKLRDRRRPEFLLVEATPHKIRQSLEAIRSRTDLFFHVAIDGRLAEPLSESVLLFSRYSHEPPSAPSTDPAVEVEESDRASSERRLAKEPADHPTVDRRVVAKGAGEVAQPRPETAMGGGLGGGADLREGQPARGMVPGSGRPADEAANPIRILFVLEYPRSLELQRPVGVPRAESP